MPFADSHTHIDLADFDSDRPALLERAAAAGVERMLLVAQADDSAGLDRGLTVARDCGLKVSGGLHPHEAIHWTESLRDRLSALGKARRICAIGEIGLDFHYDHSPRDQQREAFRQQIRIARDALLPVIIHTREADDETVAILAEEKAAEVGGVIHCFTGTQALAEAALGMGVLHFVFGHRLFRERRSFARDRENGSARSVPGRDRLPLPRPAPPPRQEERTGVCG